MLNNNISRYVKLKIALTVDTILSCCYNHNNFCRKTANRLLNSHIQLLIRFKQYSGSELADYSWTETSGRWELFFFFFFFQPFNKIVENHRPGLTGIITLKVSKAYLAATKCQTFFCKRPPEMKHTNVINQINKCTIYTNIIHIIDN